MTADPPATTTTPLIDVDVLLGPHPQRGGVRRVDDLLSTMDELGITSAVVGHTMSWLHDPAAGNLRLTEQLADQPRLAACWVMLPDTCGELGSATEFVDRAMLHSVRMVRAYPRDHGYALDDPNAASVLESVAARGLGLIVDLEQTTWSAVEAVARRHLDLPIVLSDVGYRVLRRLTGLLARTPNVFLSLTNFSSHYGIEWLAEQGHAQRMVFGTGVPLHDPADAVTRLLWSELDDSTVADIGCRNVQGLLGWPQVAR